MQDPYCHLPQLQGCLIEAEQSLARVTPAVLAQWDARAQAMGRPTHWRMDDAARESNRRTVMATFDNAKDLWVFGYGSLMWDPGLHFCEIRRAQLAHYQRRFNYRVIAGRGQPEMPGLVLALEPQSQASCHGLAFCIASNNVEAETEILWRREMLRGGYCPQKLALQTPQGAVDALVFVANTEHPDYVNALTMLETAAIVARAEGFLGTNRAYLEHMQAQLDALAIHDDYIQDLTRAVQAQAAHP